MSIVITGATGHLGRLVVDRLIDLGQPAGRIVATGRDTSRLAALAQRTGVETRRADFADPTGLTDAFAGVEQLLLVSTTTVGQRFDQHRQAIDAAIAAGATLIVYTSILNADTSRILLADEHRRTEEYLRASGAPHVILRNGWYLENYTDQLPVIRQHGVLPGSAGDGRVSVASRRDYADAAAAVLTSDAPTGGGPVHVTYELGGEAFTLTELAATLSEVLGTTITYQDLPVDDYVALLTSVGLPAEMATVLADADAGLSRGELHTTSDDLAKLIGRPPTTRDQAIRDAVAQQAG
ncbi:SDR family oxidoreductase [Parafrankia sp. FMc2]|uniref:SDR family oxidoreductase n=1 Tax=Parafrankia sp. FMc2 TaxID=3233196 RepID=UPI0034D5A99F